jgi:hypothetical protein
MSFTIENVDSFLELCMHESLFWYIRVMKTFWPLHFIVFIRLMLPLLIWKHIFLHMHILSWLYSFTASQRGVARFWPLPFKHRSRQSFSSSFSSLNRLRQNGISLLQTTRLVPKYIKIWMPTKIFVAIRIIFLISW